jgi:hypothetical protein
LIRPSKSPTIADLYLAFRQAKTAHFFERRGVGLLELSAYEQDLPNNLRALQSKLANQSWFDNIELGETWVVPKRLRSNVSENNRVVRIGAPRTRTGGQPVDIQLRLSPNPAFSIVEVLYLWRFGGCLDSLLSRKDVLGYRLDLHQGRVVPHRRWLFEYWPNRYQEFRTAPLAAAKRVLERGDQALIISGDFASFYDTVDAKFMLNDDLVAELGASESEGFEADEYRRATKSLLASYERFHAEASRRAGTRIDVGVPIGALTSRLVANLALAPLDQHISALAGVHCYRRYVDDFVIVARGGQEERSSAEILRQFIPIKETVDDILRLNVDAMGRAGSEFQLQNNKIRVHHLVGVSGIDFVEAVNSDFQKAVSERRAFIDSATLLGDGVTHLIRAGEAEGSPLRVLRDADRARLERFALSTSLHSLERVSSLVNHEQAKELVRRSLERVGRVLDAEDNWVDDLDVSLRLLKLAISTGDWKSATELNERMDRVWGSVESLRSEVAKLYYRGREIEAHKTSPWTWLRNYLHARRVEAIAASLPIGMDAALIESRLPGGVLERTSRVGARALRRRAELLAQSDLRSRDREEDSMPNGYRQNIDHEWLRTELNDDEALRNRLDSIDVFIRHCEKLADSPWAIPPARLFLCTRPPSYFDIARRWLHQVEKVGFAPDVFERLLDIVNAVRGTMYRDPVGSVIDSSTVRIETSRSIELPHGSSSAIDPRIILGNLVVESKWWEAAATRVLGSADGAPELGVIRLLGVARVLEKADRVSRGRVSAVLVLPELSLPRQWFRAVSNHVVRSGRFGLVVGLEYLHHPTNPHVFNQVFAVFPGPFASVSTWPWTKRLPAREESNLLSKLPTPISFPPPPSAHPRTVVRSPWGAVSVLICSELIEARRIADLLGRVNVVLCPAWNQDTSSYDHLIQSVGFQLFSIIAVANNGHYSDCRAWAPRSERFERDLCRLIERDVDDVVHVDIPLTSLIAFHAGRPDEGWRPLPPDWP